MMLQLRDQLRISLIAGSLWCLRGTVTYSCVGQSWKSDGAPLPLDVSTCLTEMELAFRPPVSAYSCHAYYTKRSAHPETSWYRDVFKYASQVTPMTGLLGTLHNNSSIDMTVDENPAQPSVKARTFKPESTWDSSAQDTPPTLAMQV